MSRDYANLRIGETCIKVTALHFWGKISHGNYISWLAEFCNSILIPLSKASPKYCSYHASLHAAWLSRYQITPSAQSRWGYTILPIREIRISSVLQSYQILYVIWASQFVQRCKVEYRTALSSASTFMKYRDNSIKHQAGILQQKLE